MLHSRCVHLLRLYDVSLNMVDKEPEGITQPELHKSRERDRNFHTGEISVSRLLKEGS